MAKLVMLYTVGDGCTYSCDIVEPIIYESKEKAAEDFLMKIMEIEEAQAKANKAIAIWQNRLNSIQTSSPKWMEVYKTKPPEASGSFSFGGRQFDAYSFYEEIYDSKKERYERTFVEPRFITVEEWYGDKK